jgi:hypothetical protein
MESARADFDAVGAHGHPIMCREPGGAEKRKLSCQGLVFAERCIKKMGEGGGGFNGGGWS